MSVDRIILRRIAMERERQNTLVAEGKLPFNCYTRGVPPGDKLMVLAEEAGEVAKAAYDCKYGAPEGDTCRKLRHLQIELIQLAAVAAAWAESIEERLS